MTSLELNAEHLKSEQGPFWRRQFAADSTDAQTVFDFVFCLLAPILCFYFDPTVFKGGIMGTAILQSFQLFAYSVTAVELVLFVIWTLAGPRLGTWSRLIGGTLISGAVFSAGIGIAILPYSLIGLVIVIGVFGFIPFLTAFAYLRVGWRALKSQEKSPVGSWMIPLMAGAILALALPALVSFYVSRTTTNSINAILYGNDQQAELAVGHLRWLPLIPQQNLDPLVNAYMSESNPTRKEMLKKSYQELTGETPEHRAFILND